MQQHSEQHITHPGHAQQGLRYESHQFKAYSELFEVFSSDNFPQRISVVTAAYDGSYDAVWVVINPGGPIAQLSLIGMNVCDMSIQCSVPIHCEPIDVMSMSAGHDSVCLLLSDRLLIFGPGLLLVASIPLSKRYQHIAVCPLVPFAMVGGDPGAIFIDLRSREASELSIPTGVAGLLTCSVGIMAYYPEGQTRLASILPGQNPRWPIPWTSLIGQPICRAALSWPFAVVTTHKSNSLTIIDVGSQSGGLVGSHRYERVRDCEHVLLASTSVDRVLLSAGDGGIHIVRFPTLWRGTARGPGKHVQPRSLCASRDGSRVVLFGRQGCLLFVCDARPSIKLPLPSKIPLGRSIVPHDSPLFQLAPKMALTSRAIPDAMLQSDAVSRPYTSPEIDFLHQVRPLACVVNSLERRSCHDYEVPAARVERAPETLPSLLVYTDIHSIRSGRWWQHDESKLRPFNSTGLVGLENCVLNARLANSVLQLLFHQREFRATVLQHRCNADHCVMCELEQLFAQMQITTHITAVPANLMRTTRYALAQSGRELLDTPSSHSQLPWNQRVRMFLDLFFDRLMHDDGELLAPATGIKQVRTSTCSCGASSSVSKTTPLLKLRIHPGSEEQFLQAIEAQLTSTNRHLILCQKCNTTRQSTLTVEACTPLPTAIHVLFDSEPGEPWTFPRSFSLEGSLETEYLLTGFLAYSVASEPAVVSILHLNSATRDEILNIKPDASLDSEWYLFNDFCVEPVQFSDYIGSSDLVPLFCQFSKARRDSESLPPPQIRPFINPQQLIIPRTISRSSPLFSRGVRPLQPHEFPQAGDIVAFDSEFVALSLEEAQLVTGGARVVSRPVDFFPGRVTLLRGLRAGGRPWLSFFTPFVDSAVVAEEPVADYLTRYSGLQAGDLSPDHSQYHLMSMKRMVSILRTLIDTGVVFLGHGMEQDWRTLNLFVPKEQQLDTQVIFANGARRKLALRVLCREFFAFEIQEHTHDSRVDAAAALALYLISLELQDRQDVFATVCDILYTTGGVREYLTQQKLIGPINTIRESFVAAISTLKRRPK